MGPESRQYEEARTSATGADSVVFLIRDVTERRLLEERTNFLARAGTALTSSLDFGSIVDTLAKLPVPFLADVCVRRSARVWSLASRLGCRTHP